MYIRSVTKVLTPYFNGMEHPEITSYAVVSGICLNIIMLYYLFPLYGIQGAALSMTLGYALSGTIMLIYFTRMSGIALHKVIIPGVSDITYLAGVGSQLINRYAKK